MSGLTSQYLYSKLQVKVAARIAPQNMGIKVDSPWIAGQHDPRNRFWSMEELQWRTTNEMEWFLKKASRRDLSRRTTADLVARASAQIITGLSGTITIGSTTRSLIALSRKSSHAPWISLLSFTMRRTSLGSVPSPGTTASISNHSPCSTIGTAMFIARSLSRSR